MALAHSPWSSLAAAPPPAPADPAADGQRHEYAWKGLDREGRSTAGRSTSTGRGQLRLELAAREITVTSIRRALPAFPVAAGRRIPPKDIAFFTRQLAIMLRSGLPIAAVMEALHAGQKHPQLRRVLLALKQDLLEGFPLHDALARHPRHFDGLYCSLVRTGEGSGTLESMLEALADHMERNQALKRSLRRILAYPALLLVVTIGVSAALLVWVVPQFDDMFRSFGAPLPAFTHFLLALSRGMVEKGWLVAWVLPALLAVWIIPGNRQRLQEAAHRCCLRMPLIGPALDQVALSRFARATAITFGAGVPLVEALDMAAPTTGSTIHREAVQRLRQEIMAGQTMSGAMREIGGFTDFSIQMAAVGEEAGALDEMLLRTADYYDQSTAHVVQLLGSLLEPAMMLLIGSLVGAIVTGMYLPIFQLTTVV